MRRRNSGGERAPETFPGEWLGGEVRVVGGREAERSERVRRTRLGKGPKGPLTDA